MYLPKPNPLVSRDDLQNAFLSLEEPLLARWDPDAAGIDFGPDRAWYGIQPTRLETIARYLWGLVPFTKGGGVSRGWPMVLDAIVHGTDPNHPQYWGPAGDSDQRSVEMASLGVALRLLPEKIWEPLAPVQKDRFATWMAGMVGKDLVPSNWQFFRLLVTLGLRHINRAPANTDEMEQKAITLIDSQYQGDGWYADGGGGGGGQRDYYVPMAFEFYSMLLSHFGEAGPVTARAAEWKDRTKQFGNDFLQWFSADGAALAYGRSLTYRFAQGAYWGGCAIAGVDTFSPGELKGMLLRHLRWWWKQPMLNGDGTLSLGYAYANANMCEPYNASGSPYWAFKGFAALQLPEDHPFWADKEQPMPQRPTPAPQKYPRFLIDRDPDTGHVVSLNAGQWHPGWPLRHRDAKYSKLVYSTFFGPCMGTNHEWVRGCGIDGTIAIQSSQTLNTDGVQWQNRGAAANQLVTSEYTMSDWTNVPGVTVRTWLVPAGPAWHVRIHRVQTDHDIQLAEGGFTAAEPNQKSKSAASLLAIGLDGGLSGIVNLSDKRSIDLADTEPNSSLYTSRAGIPILIASLTTGIHWIATAVFGAAPGSKASFDQPPEVDLVADSKLTVRFAGKQVEIVLESAGKQ